MIRIPPTTGSAIVMANFQPCKPPEEVAALETGDGPDISVLLKIVSASGKNAAPGVGGCRHATWRAWSTRFLDQHCVHASCLGFAYCSPGRAAQESGHSKKYICLQWYHQIGLHYTIPSSDCASTNRSIADILWRLLKARKSQRMGWRC